jgi:hypothetical protein
VRSRVPEVVVITGDLNVAHAVSLALPETWAAWHREAGSALQAIAPGTEVLVIDSRLDCPLTRLLPSLFVDQRPGRRAVVLYATDSSATPPTDGITRLPWPARLDDLAAAMGDTRLPESGIAAA